MKPNESRASDDSGRFRTTHWVSLSAQSQAPGSRTALADVYRLRWGPRALYYVRALSKALIASEGRL
jgi:hypothetical protein